MKEAGSRNPSRRLAGAAELRELARKYAEVIRLAGKFLEDETLLPLDRLLAAKLILERCVRP